MTFEEHRQRHIELHQALDELVADWLAQTPAMPSSSSVMELIRWSNEQTDNPTENRFQRSEVAHVPSIKVDRG
jgi:hypothetical protein